MHPKPQLCAVTNVLSGCFTYMCTVDTSSFSSFCNSVSTVSQATVHQGASAVLPSQAQPVCLQAQSRVGFLPAQALPGGDGRPTDPAASLRAPRGTLHPEPESHNRRTVTRAGVHVSRVTVRRLLKGCASSSCVRLLLGLGLSC